MQSTRIRSSVQPRTVRTRTSVILFDGGERRVPQPYFGKGILAFTPYHRLDCTISDLEWAAAAFSIDGDTFACDYSDDEVMDALADEAAYQDACTERYERMCLPL